MKDKALKKTYINLLKINGFLYLSTLIGLSIIPSEYQIYLDVFLRTSISLFLILRFNPFNKNEFSDYDKQIVFSSGLFLFSTTALNTFIRNNLSVFSSSTIMNFKEVSASKNDVVIAIAASGNTPYTCKIASEAKKENLYVISILNNPKGKLLRFCNKSIVLNTGPEIVAGSTRLKAGTSQKICLNIITTFLMTKLGRVKNGQMSHMVVSNKKLKIRKERIINNVK